MEQRRAELPTKNLARSPRPRELGGVHTVFNEPIYRIMAEIKKEPFLMANSPGWRSIEERP